MTNLVAYKNTHLLSHSSVGQKLGTTCLKEFLLRDHKTEIMVLAGLGSYLEAWGRSPLHSQIQFPFFLAQHWNQIDYILCSQRCYSLVHHYWSLKFQIFFCISLHHKLTSFSINQTSNFKFIFMIILNSIYLSLSRLWTPREKCLCVFLCTIAYQVN